MTVVGIVAEYNPFHNGHRLLVEEARSKLQPQAVVCVMSGPFVQRGEPAMCDKWARAQMALAGGIDLVMELPFCFAARSAYYFARGALLTLQAAGADHIVFGSESGRLDPLSKIAELLVCESASYQQQLKTGLSRGLSYPAARAYALKQILDDDSPEVSQLLSSPNNILGIEYLHIIKELGLSLKPVTITRRGSEYHDTQVSQLASATAIRQAVRQGHFDKLWSALPQPSMKILKEEIQAGRAPIPVDGLESAVIAQLRLGSEEWLKGIHEITEGLENRILSAANQSGTLAALRKAIKSKRYNLTRVNRMLLYSLFSVSKSQMARFDKAGPQYIRLLGFSSQGRKILQKVKNNSSLPVLSTGRQVAAMIKKSPEQISSEMLSLDIRASDIYSLLSPHPDQRQAGQDYYRKIIVSGSVESSGF